MNILLAFPCFPDTFWGFRHALKFVSKKAVNPPLGLLTVAAMLPAGWQKKLVDLNVSPLKDKDIEWAEYVFISAMAIQKESVREIIKRCNALGTKVVAGGPLFSAEHEEFEGVDHFVLNEAELTLPDFLEDLKNGQAKHIYASSEWADITSTPVPLWTLMNPKHYASMNIQYSRGCPFDCEFCDITVLYGRRPRTKTKEQVVAELESLYALGWRSGVFFVDDNFIGNKLKLKKEILPAMIEWMEKRKHPFSLNTEASINLADDEELMRLMVQAGFDRVFIGIESPNEKSLEECRKVQNRNRDMIASVKKLHRFGLEVQGGFIVGFDNDPASIFERLISFIQESGIVTAMVGMLNAPRGTKLYQRLMREGRMLSAFTGNNTAISINFAPKMSLDALIKGYKDILSSIYSPKNFHARVKQFLKEFKPSHTARVRLRCEHIKALFKSILILGVIAKGRVYYWRLFFWSLFRKPRLFPLSITLLIYGFHFRKISSNTC